MSEFEVEVNQPAKSKYNSAIDQMQRLGNIWRSAYKNAMEGNFNSWNLDLDAAWRELSSDIPEDDTLNEDYLEINKEIRDLQPLVSKKAPGFNPISETMLKNISKQYLVLQKKELFVRRMLNKLGKGTVYDDTEDDDFG